MAKQVIYGTDSPAALQNAASIVGLPLTTMAMISDFPGDAAATAMPGAAGGMDF